MPEDWSPQEIELILADYFRMLEMEVRGVAYVKKAFRERLKPRLRGRSDGSIEFKHQNISAVLMKFGLPYILGYKPRFNYQHLLEDAVADYVLRQPAFDSVCSDFAENLVILPSQSVRFSNFEVPPPETGMVQEPLAPNYGKRLVKVNYLEREQQNRLLGELGEELVLNYEKWRLDQAGKSSLAERVEWISKVQGDGAGFDILSRNANGTDRYIEVKTTKLGELTPIYITRNELSFSQAKAEQYHVYRVFQFATKPRLFTKCGSLDRICRLEAVEWVGRW